MNAAEHENRELAADYLNHFGLSSDPFEPGLSPLFEGGQRRELLAEMLRRCVGSTILAVLGEAGVGKSCFRHALMERMESGDRICLVDVPLLFGAEQLLRHIAEQLGISDTAAQESSPSVADWVAAIRELVEQPVEGDPLSVLIVENAHNLDNESLDCLLQLSEDRGDSQGLVHLVLFGEPELGLRLNDLEQQGRSAEIITVEPLSLADLKSYLRFRLEAADFDGVFPFGAEDMQYLWEASRGIPTAVHGPAREIIRDLAQPPPEPESFGLPLGHIVAMTVLVAGLVIVLFYRAGGPAEDPANVAQVSSGTLPIAASEPRAMQEPEASRSEVLSPRDERVGASRTEASGSGDDEPASDENATTSVGNLANDARDTDSAPASNPAPTDAVAPVPDVPPVAPLAANDASDDETRLLARSPDRFTLQISAAGSRESVGDFVRSQPNRANLSVFTARRDGKTLHIVVTGDFPSAEAARTAISELPADQRQASPWPRLLRDVQGEIRRYRGL